MTIGSNRLRQFEAFGLCLGEAILIETTAIAVKPFRIDLSQQPVGSHFRQDIEGMSQRFPCAFESIQITNGRQHMRRVCALASSRFEPATTLAQLQESLQEQRFGSSCQ